MSYGCDWTCECGWGNLDVRKSCRNCGKANPECAPATVPEPEAACEHCDGTGDVHSIDGEWKGECVCGKSADTDDVISCLLADKPFWFDPATNFVHADDGGARGTRWVPEPEAEGEAVERGWLIELKGSVPSWAIVNPHDYDEHWTTDSTKALRFARKTDAQAYIDHIGWTEAFPSEHIWDDGKARPSSEAEIADLRAKLDRMRQALRLCVQRDPGLYIHPVVRAALTLAGEEKTGASDV